MFSGIKKWFVLSGILIFACLPALAKNTKYDPQQARAAYLAHLQQQPGSASNTPTVGSLWISDSALNNMASDYKAKHLNDTVIIQVVEQTTAKSTGDVNAQRSFQAKSAISGLPGRIPTGGVNPLLTAQSSSQLKGQGATSATSTLRTSLAGRVIAVLPNGDLVVEAERQVTINSQRETMVVRGVLRPGDIAADNSALSTSLASLEVELKGKGVISDVTRAPNPLVRMVLWLVGF
jgi:flagellar L-ring protein precursor FlgH